MQISRHHQPFLTPKQEISGRISGMRKILNASGLRLAWLAYPTDRFYYTGSNQNGILLIPVDSEPVFYVKKSVSRAEMEASCRVEPYPGRKSLMKKMGEILGNSGILGLPLDVTPAADFLVFLKTIDAGRIMDITHSIRLQKAVKSPWEIAQIEEAAEQGTILFNEAHMHIRPGMTELELTASIERRLRELGHGGTLRLRNPEADLVIITAVSGNGALYPSNFDGPSGGEGPYPAAAPGAGWRRIQPNETVILDMVTTHNAYHADQTRIFFTGEDMPRQGSDAHEFCLEVQQRIQDRLKPGLRCGDVWKEVQEWIDTRNPPEGFMGYGENRVKFFGHGVGLELDEYPILAKGFDLELTPGMVIAVEPKAYIKGLGPVGVENTFVITGDGCRKLCPVDENIRSLQ